MHHKSQSYHQQRKEENMILRSSSTPVLGSLLSSSISNGPNYSKTYHETGAVVKHRRPPQSPIHHCSNNKVSFDSFNLPTVSSNSSPITFSVADFSGGSNKGIRRAQSEGNLKGLAYATSCNNEEDLDNNGNENQPSKKSSGRNKCLTLETIPSFSYSTLRGRREEDEDESEIEDHEENIQDYMEKNGEEEEISEELLQSCLKNEKIMSTRLLQEMKSMDLWNSDFQGIADQEMNLAKGLGNGGRGGGRRGRGGGGEFNPSGGDNGDNQEVEEYYKKMVEENPGNPLFLRNYAQFLCKVKRELERAEDYYSRAILADPEDGKVLSQYAMLIWELHHDEDRATSYFEKAVHASPQNSHVHATYAGFLWETEEDCEDDEYGRSDLDSITPQIHRAALASANA